MYNIKTRVRTCAVHHRLVLDSECASTTAVSAGAVVDQHDPSCPPPAVSNQIIFDLDRALHCFQIGTHELNVEPEYFNAGKQARPTGGFWVTVVPKGFKAKILKKEAILRVFVDLSTKGLVLSIPATTRAGLLETVLAAEQRDKEIERFNRKGQQGSGLLPPEPIHVPLLPRHCLDLLIQLQHRHTLFSKVHILLPAAGHRILFIEPPSSPTINRHLVWEAWLLYPIFPDAFLDRDRNDELAVRPEEGVHYRVIIRHSDTSSGLSLCCLERGSDGGTAEANLDIIKALSSTAPPTLPGTTMGQVTVSGPVVSQAELTLAVLGFMAEMNELIRSRRNRLLTFPLTVLTAVGVVVGIAVRVFLSVP